jgi:hypothetical protein
MEINNYCEIGVRPGQLQKTRVNGQLEFGLADTSSPGERTWTVRVDGRGSASMVGDSAWRRLARERRRSDTVISLFRCSRTTRGYLLSLARGSVWCSQPWLMVNRSGGCAVAVDTDPSVTPTKRVAAACLVGTAIEAYDFIIYSTAAALMFPRHTTPRACSCSTPTTWSATRSHRHCGRTRGQLQWNSIRTTGRIRLSEVRPINPLGENQ